LPAPPPQDKFQTSKLLEGVLVMSTTEERPQGAEVYGYVVGALMVALLAYGFLSLIGVVR
jgi:hypothetical protein